MFTIPRKNQILPNGAIKTSVYRYYFVLDILQIYVKFSICKNNLLVLLYIYMCHTADPIS